MFPDWVDDCWLLTRDVWEEVEVWIDWEVWFVDPVDVDPVDSVDVED